MPWPRKPRRWASRRWRFRPMLPTTPLAAAMVAAPSTPLAGWISWSTTPAPTSFVDAAALDDLTDEVWQRIFGVNLLGVFHCCRAAHEPMLATGGGQIVNVSSVAAFSGKGSSIPYAASKAGVNNLTLALARAWPPRFVSTRSRPASSPVAGCKRAMANRTKP